MCGRAVLKTPARIPQDCGDLFLTDHLVETAAAVAAGFRAVRLEREQPANYGIIGAVTSRSRRSEIL